MTMEHAIRHSIPIRIKNVNNVYGKGTVILPPAAQHGVDMQVPGLSWGNGGLPSPPADDVVQRKLPTAVTVKEEMVVLNVRSDRKPQQDFYAGIFRTLHKHSIAADLIATSKMHVSLALSSHTAHLTQLVSELATVGTVTLLQDMALVSLVGKEMAQCVGVAGTMCKVLADASINLALISQGSSEMCISLAIEGCCAGKAATLIHSAVLELPTASPRAGHFGPCFF